MVNRSLRCWDSQLKCWQEAPIAAAEQGKAKKWNTRRDGGDVPDTCRSTGDRPRMSSAFCAVSRENA